MKQLQHRIFLRVISTILVIVSLSGYVITNRFHSNFAYSTETQFDNLIPFLSPFIVPYLFYLPFIIFSLVYLLFLFGSKERLYLKRFICAQFIALTFFIFLPTIVHRPEIKYHSIFDQLVQFVYANDKPYNALPSTHVLQVLVIGNYWIAKTGHKYLLRTVMFLICVSTVLVKQHYILDIFGGILVYLVVIKLIPDHE